MEQLQEAIAERIREKGISIRSIARTCNIPEANIRNFLRGRVKNPRIDTIEAICRACGTTLNAVLGSQHRRVSDIQSRVISDAPRVESDAPRVKNDAERVENDASGEKSEEKCVISDAETEEIAAGSQNIYNPFPDECGDDILIMCHAVAHRDEIDALQFRRALEENADAEVRTAQERLIKALAARDKLKG